MAVLVEFDGQDLVIPLKGHIGNMEWEFSRVRLVRGCNCTVIRMLGVRRSSVIPLDKSDLKIGSSGK